MAWHNINISTALVIAFAIVLLNTIIGRYFAPYGIFLTPVTIVTSTIIVSLNKSKLDPWVHVVIVYVLIATNDIGIKLYSGGIHDTEGAGWVNIMLVLGVIPAFIFLAIGLKAATFKERLPLLLFIGLIILHLNLFGFLGLGRSYINN